MVWGFLISLFLCGSIQAAEYREFYLGVRALGMGGAHIATGNDETALITNPAALGKLRNTFTTVFDPEVHGSTNNAGPVFQGNFGGLLTGAAAQEQTNLTDNRNKHFHLRYSVFPSFVVPNFGFGLLYQYSMDAFTNNTGDSFEMEKFTDFMAVIGYNLRIWEGRFKLGFNLKAINRNEVTGTFDTSANETVDDIALQSEGMGFGADVGMIITMPWQVLPTLSVVGRNVGGLKFSSPGFSQSTSGRPTEIAQTADVAFAVFPIINKNVRYTVTAEVRDVLTLSEATDQMERAHVGAEVNLGDILFVRAGWHQKSISGGLEFATENMQFQIATYGEEVTHIDTGTTTFTSTDRRYAFKFAFRF